MSPRRISYSLVAVQSQYVGFCIIGHEKRHTALTLFLAARFECGSSLAVSIHELHADFSCVELFDLAQQAHFLDDRYA